MNEQMQQILKQATDDILGVKVVDQKRFADLIILECIRYINDDYCRDFDAPWREDLSNGIRQHYGIE